MDHDAYLVRLADIREQLFAEHVQEVSRFPGDHPRAALEKIISSYEPVEQLDRIIATEKPKGPPAAKPKLGMSAGRG